MYAEDLHVGTVSNMTIAANCLFTSFECLDHRGCGSVVNRKCGVKAVKPQVFINWVQTARVG